MMLNLGNALRVRFERGGALADINDAVDLTRTALELVARRHGDEGPSLSNLSGVLRARFDRTRRLADLDEAIQQNRTAVAHVRPDDLHRAGYLSNLCHALRTRFNAIGQAGDLDEAVTVGRKAVAAAEPVPTEHGGHQINLSNALLDRYRLQGSITDLEEAIAAARRAVAVTPEDHPDRAARLHSLGLALQLGLSQQQAAREETVQAFHEAATAPNARTLVRLRATAAWASLAGDAGDWPSAQQAIEVATALLPIFVSQGLNRADKEDLLKEVVTLSAHAGSCSITIGNPRRAVELLEQGRAVLWGQLLQGRTEMKGLQRVNPRLPRLETLLPAASGGPVVMINMSRWRCDALLMRNSGVEVAELPRLTLDTVVGRANEYLQVLYKVDGAARELYLARQRLDSDEQTLAAAARCRSSTRPCRGRPGGTRMRSGRGRPPGRSATRSWPRCCGGCGTRSPNRF
jgi:tetratricopeptide (TPR) repeat protein